jgi:hypothetical protein
MRLVSSVASATLFVFLVVDLHAGQSMAASRAFRFVTPNAVRIFGVARTPNSFFIPTRNFGSVRRARWSSARNNGVRFGPGFGGTWYGGTFVPAGPGIYGSGFAFGAGGGGFGIGSGPDAPYTGSAIFYPPQTKKKPHPKNDDDNKDDGSSPDTHLKKKSSLPLPQVVYGLPSPSGPFPSSEVIDSNLP